MLQPLPVHPFLLSKEFLTIPDKLRQCFEIEIYFRLLAVSDRLFKNIQRARALVVSVLYRPGQSTCSLKNERSYIKAISICNFVLKKNKKIYCEFSVRGRVFRQIMLSVLYIYCTRDSALTHSSCVVFLEGYMYMYDPGK